MCKQGGVKVSVMFAFGRGCGNPLNSGFSPYPQVSSRLESMGHNKAEDESDRRHCIRLESVIVSVAKNGKKKDHKATEKPISAKAAPKANGKKHPITLGTDVDVRSIEFLSTYAWRKVRMEALKKHGPVCQCCGASPATGAVMNVDHIKPRKLFPELALDLDNLQILCGPCNHGKGNWDATDWRKP